MTSDVVHIAERLVRERFPDACAAWLGGSAATRSMTNTSDLDITVLLPSAAPFRESLTVAGQPVELFVHTKDSLEFFCAEDRRRRRPTLLRLIGTSIVLVDTDGVGERLRDEFNRLDGAGPSVLTADEVDTARYAVTDLLDDLRDADQPEALIIAATLLRETAELILGAHGRWSGTGKWLLRELRASDADRDTHYADALLSGLAATSYGDTTVMQTAVSAALAAMGGPLFDGYRRTGTPSHAQSLFQPRLDGEGVVLRPFAEADTDVVIEAGRDALIPSITTVSPHGDSSDALDYVRTNTLGQPPARDGHTPSPTRPQTSPWGRSGCAAAISSTAEHQSATGWPKATPDAVTPEKP